MLKELQNDIFFVTADDRKNWREIKRKPENCHPEFSTTEKNKGYVVFTRDYVVKIFPDSIPHRHEIGKPITTFVSPGEFEPASACIYPLKDLGTVNVECSDFTSRNGETISRNNINIGIVRCWRQRIRETSGPAGHYSIQPEVIEPCKGRIKIVKLGKTKQWWFTVKVPDNAAPGKYISMVTFSPENASPVTLKWKLIVLPIKLLRPDNKHWGTWTDSFPPLGLLHGPARRGRNTPEEIDRIAALEIQDFIDHGFDTAIIEGSAIREIANEDGSFSYDLDRLYRIMKQLKSIGKSGIVPICFEYFCRRMEYKYADKKREKHVPGTFSKKAKAAIVGAVRAMEKARIENNWPRFLYMPIDEPGNSKTANRMMFGARVLAMVHEVPGAKTACTITANDILALGKRVDTRIYCYGHYIPQKAMDDAKKGFPFWYYCNGMFYSENAIMSRGMTGIEFMRSGASTATAWGFAATYANPYNDFDSHHEDWNVIFRSNGKPTPTIYWELCREGIDDCRYIHTLKTAIAKAEAAGNKTGARQAKNLLQALLAMDAKPISVAKKFNRIRWRIAQEILTLSGNHDYMENFQIPCNDLTKKEILLENVIQNSSFEKGPNKDGLPGWPFPWRDPFLDNGKKPSGAIIVSDECAHSGRYSLKWDLSKAWEAGTKYGGKRYLIINVQIAKNKLAGLRGHKVKIGMWVKIGKGLVIPSDFRLRMCGEKNGKNTYLGGIAFKGGVSDTTVWNKFEAEGKILDEAQKIDIHIPTLIPAEKEKRDNAYFYIDDIYLRAYKKIPVTIDSPYTEYFTGEPIEWNIITARPYRLLTVSLMQNNRIISSTTHFDGAADISGFFATNLAPGKYTLQATTFLKNGDSHKSALKEIIVTQDPFSY